MPSWRPSAATRIGLAWSGAYALGIALLGAIVFLVMHLAFTRQLDAMVEDEADTLTWEYQVDGGKELASAIAEREASRSPARLLYAVFAPDGRRVMGTLQAARPALGIHDIAFTEPGGGSDLARALAVDLSPKERLVVAADREWIERTDHTVIVVFAAGFFGVCLLGLIGGLLFGAYLRRRLRSISSGAEAISAGKVGERMPVGPNLDEFDQLAMTLNRMLSRIEGLVANLRQVSSDIAHDLRTPLSQLRNRLERAFAAAAAGEDAAPLLEEAIQRVDEALGLFASILRIAEVESGETRRFFAPVDLSLLVEELAESYAPAINGDGRRFAWSIDPGLSVSGDRELLAQATANLLDNAQRHTPRGSAIRLTLTADAARIALQVADNGPGVPASDWATIIQRFKRLDRSRHAAGYGLGLNLVSAVAQLHGGRLAFHDAAPGLAATIELPLNGTAATPSA